MGVNAPAKDAAVAFAAGSCRPWLAAAAGAAAATTPVLVHAAAAALSAAASCSCARAAFSAAAAAAALAKGPCRPGLKPASLVCGAAEPARHMSSFVSLSHVMHAAWPGLIIASRKAL